MRRMNALIIAVAAMTVGPLELAATPTAAQVAPPAAKQWNVNNTDRMTNN